MADPKKLSVTDALQFLAKGLRESADRQGERLLALRRQELRKAEADVCLMCGEPDLPGRCTCLKKARADEGLPLGEKVHARQDRNARTVLTAKTPAGQHPRTGRSWGRYVGEMEGKDPRPRRQGESIVGVPTMLQELHNRARGKAANPRVAGAGGPHEEHVGVHVHSGSMAGRKLPVGSGPTTAAPVDMAGGGKTYRVGGHIGSGTNPRGAHAAVMEGMGKIHPKLPKSEVPMAKAEDDSSKGLDWREMVRHGQNSRKEKGQGSKAKTLHHSAFSVHKPHSTPSYPNQPDVGEYTVEHHKPHSLNFYHTRTGHQHLGQHDSIDAAKAAAHKHHESMREKAETKKSEYGSGAPDMAMAEKDGPKVSWKRYGCKNCGHEQSASTNHTGDITDICRNCSWKGSAHKGGYAGGERPKKVYVNQGGGNTPRRFEYIGEEETKKSEHPETKCKQCGKGMNPAEAAGGPVCYGCAKKNHKKVVGKAEDCGGMEKSAQIKVKVKVKLPGTAEKAEPAMGGKMAGAPRPPSRPSASPPKGLGGAGGPTAKAEPDASKKVPKKDSGTTGAVKEGRDEPKAVLPGDKAPELAGDSKEGGNDIAAAKKGKALSKAGPAASPPKSKFGAKQLAEAKAQQFGLSGEMKAQGRASDGASKILDTMLAKPKAINSGSAFSISPIPGLKTPGVPMPTGHPNVLGAPPPMGAGSKAPMGTPAAAGQALPKGAFAVPSRPPAAQPAAPKQLKISAKVDRPSVDKVKAAAAQPAMKSEPPAADLKKSLGACALCGAEEHGGGCSPNLLPSKRS